MTDTFGTTGMPRTNAKTSEGEASITIRPGTRVVVTGAGSGLGRATVQAVLDAGGDAVGIDIDTSRVPDGADRYEADISDREQVEQVFATIAADLGDVSALVTAAGIDRPGPFGDVAADDWERVVKVNLLGTANTVRAALPLLQRTSGRVITVASSLGLRALPEASAYCASKFGLIGLSRSLAAEFGESVLVSTVIPAGMDTEFFSGRAEQYRPAPDARLNDPANVAQAILFILAQPQRSVIRELTVCPPDEPSWP